MKLYYFPQTFEKKSNIKLHKYPSNGSPPVPWGRTEERTDGLTDRQAGRLS